MGFTFTKATKTQSKARVALIGPSGSGKTYSALAIACALGKRVAVIDTEHGSARKYAHKFDFDVLELDSFSPTTYVQAIAAAVGAGYDVLVIDSLSHAWSGKGGALEMVDAAAKRNSGNSYVGWRDVTPKHNDLVEALSACACHLVVTMRSKMEYVLEEDSRGKKVPRKIGLAPIQREGLEYEFDVVGDISLEHDFVISKTRCEALDGVVVNKPGAELAQKIKAWLEDGAPAPVKTPGPVAAQNEKKFGKPDGDEGPRFRGKPDGELTGRLIALEDAQTIADYIVALNTVIAERETKGIALGDLREFLASVEAVYEKKLADEDAEREEAARKKDRATKGDAVAEKLQAERDSRGGDTGNENRDWGMSSQTGK